MSTADEYWSIDIPGLTENEATSLQKRLAGEFDDDVIVVSPRDFMVRGFDHASVVTLVSCLRAGLAGGGVSGEGKACAQGLLEDFEAWLDRAEG